jgi:hypothetical protein
MNKNEYKEYQSRVINFFDTIGIVNLSVIQIGEETTEPYFSWRPCDCCGSRLGGMRVDANGYNPTAECVMGPFSICLDCEFYSEYGELDNQTMLDMIE